MEDFELRSDVDLLLSLLNDTHVRSDGIEAVYTRKQFACWTGISEKTISDYCTGKYNIPVDFWRRLFEQTRDLRICALILGNVHCEIFNVRDTPDTSRDYFRAAIEESGLYHDKQKMICDLLADGRIDELDHDTVRQYAAKYLEQRTASCELHRAIMRAYHAATNGKEANR